MGAEGEAGEVGRRGVDPDTMCYTSSVPGRDVRLSATTPRPSRSVGHVRLPPVASVGRRRATSAPATPSHIPPAHTSVAKEAKHPDRNVHTSEEQCKAVKSNVQPYRGGLIGLFSMFGCHQARARSGVGNRSAARSPSIATFITLAHHFRPPLSRAHVT